MEMSAKVGKWSVFENVKGICGAPEALMNDINAAISALEYARAAAAAPPQNSHKPMAWKQSSITVTHFDGLKLLQGSSCSVMDP